MEILGDLSPRAAEVLESVGFIAAEDSRVSVKLLNHLGIKKPLVSCHEHNIREASQSITARLLAGEDCAHCHRCGHALHLRPR